MKFFLLHGSLWHREPHGCHQLVVPEHHHFRLIKEAHDDLGHKGVFTVRTRLLLHFWWLMLVEDVKWFVRTCHKCQLCQTCQLHIPPTMLVIGGLFRKVHLDTMVMPQSAGYWYMYCSSSLCIDRLPRVADVVFQERLCPRFLYF